VWDGGVGRGGRRVGKWGWRGCGWRLPWWAGAGRVRVA
jgi:hypothetical protein